MCTAVIGLRCQPSKSGHRAYRGRRLSALAPFGVFRPLRWLPLTCFAIGYKAIRLALVAVPLREAGTLWGIPTGEIASTFLALSLLAAVVPWDMPGGRILRGRSVWPTRARALVMRVIFPQSEAVSAVLFSVL